MKHNASKLVSSCGDRLAIENDVTERSTIFDIPCGSRACSHFYNTPSDWSQRIKLAKRMDEYLMTTSLLLRIASVISLVFTAGHTLCGPQKWSPMGENEVLKAMSVVRFDTMGANRSYLDFFMGFGWSISVLMLLEPVLLRHVRGNRLGGSAPIFVPTPAATPFRLARFSRSGRDSRHDDDGGPLQSRVPTEHLHGFEISSGIAFVQKGGFDGFESRKNRVVPLWVDCDAGFGEAAARRDDPPCAPHV